MKQSVQVLSMVFLLQIKDAFHLNISRKSEIYWNIKNANHSTKNSGTFRSKIEWNGNFQEVNFQHLGLPREFVFFTEIVGFISVQSTRTRSSTHYWKCHSEIQIGIFGRMDSALRSVTDEGIKKSAEYWTIHPCTACVCFSFLPLLCARHLACFI